MAKPDISAQFAQIKRRFGWRDLIHDALWGVCTAGALFIAVYAATTEIGRDRLHLAFAEIHNVLAPSGIKPIRPLDAAEGRQLAETVETLAADRERLLARIAALEESVGSITGSIARVEKAAREATPPPEPPTARPEPAAPPTAPAEPTLAAPAEPAPATIAPEDVTSSINPPSAIPLPPPAAPARKTEFGLDLGTATSVEALRTAWTINLRRHGSLLEGLHPVVRKRERPRPGGTEFRLIAGPIASAATAARLCATMTAAGAICAPAAFDGQRLAVH